MPTLPKTLSALPLLAGLLLIAACSHDRRGTEACGPGSLGISRTIYLSASSPPVAELLQPGEVILSFDDGPHVTRTRQVLDLLRQDCTQASFFLLGEAAATHPEIVRQIVLEGHTVGSHSWNHRNLAKLEIEEAVEDALAARRAVEAATGSPEPFFRFPFIDTTPELSAAIREAGLIDVTVTVDGQDWTSISPRRSAEMILQKLEDNDRRGIVLLHDTFFASDQRTRHLLHLLRERGYRVVALAGAEG